MDCPQFENVTNCTGVDGRIPLEIGRIPTYFSLVSCSLSCLGSLLIFFSYFALKGIRNVAQRIITLLAVADLFTALGYLLAGWNYLSNGSKDRCDQFQHVCEVQSFVTSWSSLSSFGWTSALALHFYLLLMIRKRSKLSTLLYWENLLLWLVPLVILVPLLVTHKLGYSHFATSNWCFIRSFPAASEEVVLIFLGGKLWEILCYFFVVTVYTLTSRRFNQHVSHAINFDALCSVVFTLERLRSLTFTFISLSGALVLLCTCVI